MLVAASAIMIAACGGKKNSSGPEAAVEEKAAPSENDVFTGSKDSKEAAEFCFRKNYGINFKDITPEFALGEGDKYDFYGDDGHLQKANSPKTSTSSMCARFTMRQRRLRTTV